MTRASDLAKLLGAGATINDGTTITTADNTPQLKLISTDADANAGPILELKRDSSSPAADDFLGNVDFIGENNANEEVVYGEIFGRIEDVTDGAEDGRVTLKTMRAGSSRSAIDCRIDAIIINDDGDNVDFRVESDGETHALFVQAGSDCVGIKTTSPNDYYADDFVVTAPDEGGMTIVQGTGHRGYLAFADGTSGSQAYRGYISYDHNDDTLYLGTDGGGKLLIDTNGAVTKPSQPAFKAVGTNAAYITTTPVQFNNTSLGDSFNTGSHFNTSTYKFTAPIAGRYLFHLHMGIINIGAANGHGYPYIRVNDSGIAYSYNQFTASATYAPAHVTQILELAANDYVNVTFGGSNSTYYGNYTELSFMGCLLG